MGVLTVMDDSGLAIVGAIVTINYNRLLTPNDTYRTDRKGQVHVVPEGLSNKLDVTVSFKGMTRHLAWPVNWFTGTVPPRMEVVLNKASDRDPINIGRLTATGSVVVLAVTVVGKYSRGAYNYVRNHI